MHKKKKEVRCSRSDKVMDILRLWIIALDKFVSMCWRACICYAIGVLV